MNKYSIEKLLKNLPMPTVNCDKINETIRRGKKEYIKCQPIKEMLFFDFLRGQVKYISREIWLIQFAFLFIFCLLITQNATILIFSQTEVLLSTLSPIIVMLGFGEVLKSDVYKMAEIESVTRFSTKSILAARLIVMTAIDIVCLTVVIIVTATITENSIFSFILYLLVPFLLTLSACLTVMNRHIFKNERAACLITGVAVSAVFYMLSFVNTIYTVGAQIGWIIIFIITCSYIAREIFFTTRSIKEEIFSKNIKITEI